MGCLRSRAIGFGALMAVGYAYGIVRGNLPQPATHFIFDFGVAGFYIALLSARLTPAQSSRLKRLQPWLGALAGWPILLFFFPVQDPIVQLVGLRGQIFFLPFIAVGAIFELEDYYVLAQWLAVLNLIALCFGTAEYFVGIQSFFPRNANTALIYSSKDLLGFKEFRIPSTFSSSAAYSGTMVITMPLVLGAWARRRRGWMEYYLFSGALVATAVGVFLGASRTQALLLFVMLAGTFVMGHLSLKVVFRAVLIIVSVGWLVSNNPRLQRFTTLQDVDLVEERVAGSVNESFWGAIVDYPMGNGLGGGGTSIPYFLQDRLRNPVSIENQYASIVIEEGILGLMIWLTFLIWTLSSRQPKEKDARLLALKLARTYTAAAFAAAMLGTGILTAIPETPILLMYLGWISTAAIRAAAGEKVTDRARVSSTYFATN